WVPERHFTDLGCLYPNPAVLQAALARETQRVRLQAGSVVLPLHHPIRVAEEWAMVDNLSGGRVGISFASGWNPSDFAFFPERYPHRYAEMYEGIQQVQKLWRGESISITRGDGQRQDVRVYPTPIQTELPIWVTAASNPQTFIKAGELGANLLTHLFDQEVEILAEKIALYRQARLNHGYDPEAGQVTATLHTFVGDDLAVVQEQVRSPYCDYLKSNINLLQGLGYSRGFNVSVDTLSPADLDSVTHLVFEKFFHDRRALLGTPESCRDLVEQLRQIGVNEIACLLDFGPDAELILDNLPHLNQLRQACAAEADTRPLIQTPLDLTRSLSLSTPAQPQRGQTSNGPDLDGSLDEIQARCLQTVSGSAFYQRIQAQGVELGTSFQGIVQLWRGDSEALGKIQLPASLASQVAGYGVHPALLDACLQIFFATIPIEAGGSLRSHYLPASVGQLQLMGELQGEELWSHAALRSEAVVGAPAYTGDVRILNGAGQVVMRVTGLHLQQALAEQRARPTDISPNVKDWFYSVEWQPRPRPTLVTQPPSAPDYLPSPLDIGQSVHHQMSQQQGWEPLAVYQSLFPKLDALSTAYILWAFHQMGIGLQLGQQLSVAAINQQVQVVSAHQRLLYRLLQILQETEVSEAIADNKWRVCQAIKITDPRLTWQALQAEYPQCSAELDLLGRCGQQLAAVLQGQADPLQLLFPEGSLSAVERLYQDSPGSRVANRLVQQTITAALAKLPEDRTVRILEIGAGTGGTTTSVLPHLPANRTEYCFTDVSYLFMAKAEQKFQDYPFVQYQVLDIEQDPLAQGFLAHHYDLIVAANVLHATADMTQTLAHVKQLLASEGMLVLLEGTQPQAWVDLIFGLTEGWWKFTDTALRSDSALLSATQWRQLLQILDFAPIEVITAETEALAQQAVIVATGPKYADPEHPPQQTMGETTQGGTIEATTGNWLLFADECGIGRQLAVQLQTQGDRCVLVVPGETYQIVEPDQIQLNPNQSDDFQRLFRWIAAHPSKIWRGLIYLWGLNATATPMTAVELESACHWTAQSPLFLLQALDGVVGFQSTPLWWVTQGAQPIGAAGQPLAIAQSLLWGLGRVLAVEQPQQWGGLIDLDPQQPQPDPATQATDLLSVLQDPDHQDEHLAFRQRQCYSAQLTPGTAKLAQVSAYRWQTEASYLISGGLGDLGLFVAGWMAEQGVRHIVLLWRSPLPPRAVWQSAAPDSSTAKRIAAVQAIEQQGTKVYLAHADVADEGQMAAAIAAVKQQGCPAIRGVFHLAVVPHPLQPFKQLDAATLAQVLKPKVQGSWCLHRLLDKTPLDFFVMFSSWAGLLGEVGQQIGSYSMANAFLDALAHHRQALGQPALSIDWGDWAEIGMRSRYVRQGYQLLPDNWTLKPAQGLQSLNQLLNQPTAQMAVLPVPWSEYFKLFPRASTKAFLKPIAQTSGEQAKVQAQTQAQIQFLQQLANLPADERVERLITHVQTQVALIMGISPPESLDLERGLFEMGMDSLMALELKSTLESSLGASIPAVAAFEHPSVVALSTYLAQEILAWETPSQLPPATTPDSTDAVDDPLDKIAQLSDDEVERLFAEKIAR
ncbi:MAG: MupA/Atu3671 family FMN-dependent luciferase-like monooxygenase, partial [Cyanobacteria bacterium J06659_2]